MVKRGSSQLRWALHEAARLMSIWSPSMRRYLDKKRSEGKHFNVAISHVVKKLVRIIFQLLKNGQPYDEEKMIVNKPKKISFYLGLFVLLLKIQIIVIYFFRFWLDLI